MKCLLHELVPSPLSYFFLVLCSLAPHNLKRSLNVFWCQVLSLGLGLEAQVLVNNSAVLQIVSLTFNELTLDVADPLSPTNCMSDSLSVYDGASDNSPLLGTFCTVVPSTIISSGPSLFVEFQTDHSVNTGRFSLNWTHVSIRGRGRGWFYCHKRVWFIDSLLYIYTFKSAEYFICRHTDCTVTILLACD